MSMKLFDVVSKSWKVERKSTQLLLAAASSLPLSRFSLLFSLTVESVPFHLSLPFHRNHHHHHQRSISLAVIHYSMPLLLEVFLSFSSQKRVK
jgi:hypothetical protein